MYSIDSQNKTKLASNLRIYVYSLVASERQENGETAEKPENTEAKGTEDKGAGESMPEEDKKEERRCWKGRGFG